MFSAGSDRVQEGFSACCVFSVPYPTRRLAPEDLHMLNFNKLFLALAFLGGSAAAQAAESNVDVSRTDFARSHKKLTGIMMASTAKLSDAAPAMSAAYAAQSTSLTEGPDSYLPVYHRL
jgi:hypothetical protein